jgi:predicted metal-binding protein
MLTTSPSSTAFMRATSSGPLPDCCSMESSLPIALLLLLCWAAAVQLSACMQQQPDCQHLDTELRDGQSN